MAKHICTEFQVKFDQRNKIIKGALNVFDGIFTTIVNYFDASRPIEMGIIASKFAVSALTSDITPYILDSILLEYQLIESDYQFQEITLLHSKGLRFVQLLGKLPYEQPNPTDSVIGDVSAFSIKDLKSIIFGWNTKFPLAVDVITHYEKFYAVEQNSNDVKMIVALKKAANDIAVPINDYINAHNLYYANVPDNQVDNIYIFNQEDNHG